MAMASVWLRRVVILFDVVFQSHFHSHVSVTTITPSVPGTLEPEEEEGH